MALLISVLFLLLSPLATASSHSTIHPFIHCLQHHHALPSHLLLSPNSTSFSTLLSSSVQNLRVVTPRTATLPLLIITPTSEPHVQAAVICARTHGQHLRVRSGSHDYEGLSYRSDGTPFVILDLRNLRSISIDAYHRTAWVQAGATLGELYYRIAEKSKTLAFPAGICTSVGVGGHFSGGGIGTMMRAHGLASDHVIDARLVTADGEILNRRTMGEDLFWAIRGGGASSFAVVLSYKITLVEVPSKVTVFSKSKTLGEGATRVISEWQQMAHKVDNRLFVRATLLVVGDEEAKNKTILANFDSLFLGGKDELLHLTGHNLPGLGLEAQDCLEMSWIETVPYFANFKNGTPPTDLLDRMPEANGAFKAKSDFVSQPITETAWERIWSWMLDSDVERPIMIIDPLGGRIDEISESDTPFPHRKGSLYNIQHLVRWGNESDAGAAKKHVDWLRHFYELMTPYVSKNPRAAYLNYRDLDLGKSRYGKVSYSKARVWGTKYFKGNFKRLANVKSIVDPTNFFWHEQSITPVSPR